MKEVIIIGGGPAGVSAALYTVRAGLPTRILYRDGGALARAERIENLYGFPSPLSGKELAARAREGAERLGVAFEEGEVTSLMLLGDGRYQIAANGKEYFADGVVLATGAERKLPPIPGVEALLGRGVSTCAVCDSFAARRRHVAVIGAGEYALHEAEALFGVAASVTLCTNGETAPDDARFLYETVPVAAIEEEGGAVSAVRFADERALPVSMVFLAVGVAGAARLAASLGLAVEDGRIVTDSEGRTALPRLYAAGDCTGGFMQIATAMAKGATAGVRLAAELKK